jgi:hypothetical protein
MFSEKNNAPPPKKRLINCLEGKMNRLEHRLFFWLLDRFMDRNLDKPNNQMPHIKLLTKNYYLWADKGGFRDNEKPTLWL